MRGGSTEVVGPISPLFIISIRNGLDVALINHYGYTKALSNHIGQKTLLRLQKK